MNTQNSLEMSERELMIRLDERVKSLQDQIGTIQGKLISPSQHRDLITDVEKLKETTSDLVNWRSKIIGYSIGASASVSGAVVLLTDILKGIAG